MTENKKRIATVGISVVALWVSLVTLARDRIEYSCPRQGHYYEARHSQLPDTERTNAILAVDYVWASDKGKAIERIEPLQVYKGDVCRYCGEMKNAN